MAQVPIVVLLALLSGAQSLSLSQNELNEAMEQVESMDNGGDYLTDPQRKVIVLPKYKVAFCYMEKNACTQFKKVFGTLNGEKHDPSAARLSRPDNFGLKLKDLTPQNGWKWGAFFRDPRERYLSSFLGKCGVHPRPDFKDCEPQFSQVQTKKKKGSKSNGTQMILNDTQMILNGTQMKKGNQMVPDDQRNNMTYIEEQFKHGLEMNSAHNSKSKRNPHWGNQHDFCGGLEDRHLDFVGNVNGTMNEQIKDMLRQFKVNIFEFGKTEKVIDRYFPLDHKVLGQTSETGSFVKRLLADKSTWDKLSAHFEDDLGYLEKTGFPLMQKPEPEVPRHS